jgi:flagellar basal-body rod modification protein FlgD
MATVNGIEQTSSAAFVENPKGKLGNEEFLQLFLTELQYQDPTEPMDTQNILEQTSQLATLEANEAMKESMAAVVEKLESGAADQAKYALISSIGKTAKTDLDALQIDADTVDAGFELFFSQPIADGYVNIYQGEDYNPEKIVKTIPLSELAGQSGIVQFGWNATDANGEKVEEGIYKVEAVYSGEDGLDRKTNIGTYPISSVRFTSEGAQLKLGSYYVSSDNITEIY